MLVKDYFRKVTIISYKTVQLPTQTPTKTNFPKFLINSNEPLANLRLASFDLAGKELDAEALREWYGQKRNFRRYARKLRRDHG